MADAAHTLTRYAGTPVGGWTASLAANFTRPNDTTAYAAGDAVTDSTGSPTPTILTFSSAARVAGGSGWIVGAVMVKSTNGSTGDAFDLVLADTTFTPTNDNSAFAVTDAESRTMVGVINFTSATDLGANNRLYIGYPPGGPIPFVTASRSEAALYGGLIARGAYAPGAQERFDIRLLIAQD